MKLTNSLRIGAEILLGATIVAMLYVGLNGIANDNYTSKGLLIPIVIYPVFMWLGWNWPLETGLALTVIGATVLVFFENIVISPIAWHIVGGSTLATGLLLLGASWKFNQTHEKQPPS